MRLLVTGSSGYVARFLIPALRQRGHQVAGTDRRPAGAVRLDRFVQGELLEPGVVEEAMEGVDGVVHLAAAKGDWGIPDDEYQRDNLEATRALVRHGRERGIREWVFYSSVAAMGPSEVPLREDDPLSPRNAYGRSKAAAEKLFHDLAAHDPAARVLVVRPSVVFGPHNPESTNIYRLIEAIRRDRFVMIGDGRTVKSTSYIHNLVPATLFLMDRMAPGVRTYTYVDEPALTTEALVDLLCGLLGKERPRWRLPLPFATFIARVSDVAAAATGIDLPITAARISKFCTATHYDASAIRRLGFVQPFGNREALQETVNWHLNARPARPATSSRAIAGQALT